MKDTALLRGDTDAGTFCQISPSVQQILRRPFSRENSPKPQRCATQKPQKKRHKRPTEQPNQRTAADSAQFSPASWLHRQWSKKDPSVETGQSHGFDVTGARVKIHRGVPKELSPRNYDWTMYCRNCRNAFAQLNQQKHTKTTLRMPSELAFWRNFHKHTIHPYTHTHIYIYTHASIPKQTSKPLCKYRWLWEHRQIRIYLCVHLHFYLYSYLHLLSYLNMQDNNPCMFTYALFIHHYTTLNISLPSNSWSLMVIFTRSCPEICTWHLGAGSEADSPWKNGKNWEIPLISIDFL